MNEDPSKCQAQIFLIFHTMIVNRPMKPENSNRVFKDGRRTAEIMGAQLTGNRRTRKFDDSEEYTSLEYKFPDGSKIFIDEKGRFAGYS